MKLSVIIPVFNVELYLEECVLSLYKQNLLEEDFEVIIINDGSTDRSLELARKLSEQYNNIKLFSQENKGLSATRNRAISEAKGDYVFFLDSDDYIYPSTIKSIIDKAYKYDLEILRFDYRSVDELGKDMEVSAFIDKRLKYSNKVVDGAELVSKIYNREFFSCLSLIKRRFLLDSNVRFVEGMYFEDIEFSIKLALKSSRAMYVPDIIYAYRKRSTSILHTFNMKKVEDIIKISSNLKKTYLKENYNNEVKSVVKENITQLMVSLLLRVAESNLFNERKVIFTHIKSNNLTYLYLQKNIREFIIPFLYNLFGIKSLYILRFLMSFKNK